ncbi:hypothetical protein EXIGLDRAFT_775356 [Exidia glandulosa HHB12029]|uniref:Uncharacterized protein n=1 Tax=Exidia glandulosa HHB12029 TaxID=1314781 RepID=A0A165DY03_EXIGL|nr:hypothetical protein EXIGLDRAFT_775356 [Exidia glandulosa HHB12029]
MDTPSMGNPAGDSTIVGMIVSPVKDHETAVQFLDACGLWAKQPGATVQQTVTALRRALLQAALYTSRTIENPALCNALLAIYHVFCTYKGELATGAFDSTAVDLSADTAEAIGNQLHETVLGFLTGDKDSTNADGSERPSLLRMIDESVERHCGLLSGTVRAEAVLTRERIDAVRGDIVEKVTSQTTTSAPRLYSEALLGPALRVDRFAGRSREEQDAISRVEIQERQVLIDPDPTLVALS